LVQVILGQRNKKAGWDCTIAAATLEQERARRIKLEMTSCSCFSGLMMASTPPSTPKFMSVDSNNSLSSSGSKNGGLVGLIESVASWHNDAVDASGMGEVERMNSKERLSTASLQLMRRNSKDGLHKIWDNHWARNKKRSPSHQSSLTELLPKVLPYRISYHSMLTVQMVFRVIGFLISNNHFMAPHPVFSNTCTKILGMTSITWTHISWLIFFTTSPFTITWAYDMSVIIVAVKYFQCCIYCNCF